jgi:5-formyltetrahydrofolate cyclo-ligase
LRVALSDPTLATARRTLRARLRSERRALTPVRRALASRLIARHLDAAFPLRAGRRIALYASLPEEVDTTPLIELAGARGCAIFLPRIERRPPRMRFVAAGAATRMNHLGIHEPARGRSLDARWLDLVVLPLVGFDTRGMRLGMGGGYYDRTFGFRRIRTGWPGPRLVGIAFALQQVPHLVAAHHDVFLDAVVTERGVIQCRTGS